MCVCVCQNESPYKRATYRYTPLLAWLLTPNIYLHHCFGKLLFIVCDLLAGCLIYELLMKQECAAKTALLCAQIWLLNPLTMVVSTRGNAESIMAALVLGTLYFMRNGKSHLALMFAAVIYAVSIHVKLYPVIYALAIYLYIDDKYASGQSRPQGPGQHKSALQWDVWLNRWRLAFGAIGALVLLGLTGGCYYL